MFKKQLLSIPVILFISLQASAQTTYPKEITTFIENREQCDHLRGEISGEASIDEARDLNANLEKYCRGTDKQLRSLKIKYKSNPEVLKKLNEFDPDIE